MAAKPPKAGTAEFQKGYLSFDSSETLSFLRPFFRRLASTLRPLADCMRLRKP
jgi:hypothetical protein